MKVLVLGHASADDHLAGAAQGLRQQRQTRVSGTPTFSQSSRGLSPSFIWGRQSPWVEGPGNSSPGAPEIIHSPSCCFRSFSFIYEWINVY